MRTNNTERRLNQINNVDAMAPQHLDSRMQQKTVLTSKSVGDRAQSGDRLDSSNSTAVTEERLAVMAAIAKEVAEQSEAYSHELETELHRLATENQVLRELLAIETADGTATAVAEAAASMASSSLSSATAVGSSFKSGAGTGVGGGSGRGIAANDEWAGVPNAFK